MAFQPNAADATHSGIVTTGTQTFGGLKSFPGGITGLPSAVNPSDAVGLSQAQGLVSGIQGKTAVVAVTTAALAGSPTYSNGTAGVGATLTKGSNGAFPTVDGVTVNLHDRVLVWQEGTAANNGIYQLSTVGDGSNPWVLTRVTDADTAAEIAQATVYTSGGSTYPTGTGFNLPLSAGSITMGSTALNFVLFAPATTPSIGNLDSQGPSSKGVNISGNVLAEQSASATMPGLVNTTTQTFAGKKTFSGGLIAATGTTSLEAANFPVGVLKTALVNGDWGFDGTHLYFVIGGVRYQIDQQGLSAIADHTLLANTSGISAVPISTTLTALLDNAIGSTRGSILYRGASAWVLATPGTAGTVWTSNGAGADPAYAAAPTSGNIATTVDYQTPSSGFDVTPTKLNTIFQPTTSLSRGTIEVPSAPADGDMWTFLSTQDIGSLSFFPGATLYGPVPPSMTAGKIIRAVYRSANTSWTVLS